MTINFGLANGGGFQNALATGLQLGQMARQQQDAREFRNALAQYDPANPETLKPVMAADPRVGLQLRAQQAEAAQAQQQQRKADLPVLARLIDHAQDPATYQQALQAAQSYGIDVSQAPPSWEQGGQQFVAQQKMVLDAIQTPRGQEVLSAAGKIAFDEGLKPGTPEFAARVSQIWHAEQAKTIPYQAGGGVANYDPTTGQVTPLVVPNPGGMPAGAPVAPPPPPGFVLDNGGPTQPASGGFHPVGLPGERVTSTLRSAAHNKAVGGVPNSYHLRGLARDSVPPPGMSMHAYAAELQRLNPGLQVINEGDHVHLEPRG